MNFTHLHLHSQYSLLDGAILIPDLITYLKEMGMTSCAITDHGWMAGVVDFYKKCREEKIKPILGVEAYITEDPDGLEHKTRDNMHMVLLAKDNEGYKLLLDLISKAALNNFYYKPRIYKNHLEKLKGHVVATTACLGGVLAKKVHFTTDMYGCAVVAEDDGAQKDAEYYRSIFDEDFYLELQVWNDDDNYQQVYNQFLLNLGKNHGFQFVLAADAHYLKQEDSKLHEVLMAMQFKKTLLEYKANANMLYGPHFYVAGPEEMMRRAKEIDCIEAYENTQKIADACNVEITLGEYQEPVFSIEETDDYQEFLEWRKNVNK